MEQKATDSTAIPGWYPATFRLVQQIEGSLRSLELKLHEAIEIDALDERVRAQMQVVLDALHMLKGNLVLVDMTAGEVLDQIMKDATSATYKDIPQA